MLKNDEWEKINSTTFKSLVRNLRYLTCSRPNILFGVRLVSKFIEIPITIHFKALKQILHMSKVLLIFILFYGYSNSFDLWVIVIVIGLEIWMIKRAL